MKTMAIARDWFRIFGESKQRETLLEKMRKFKCRLQVYFETEEFIIRSATSPNDLQKVLELRHEIFIKEWQGRHKMHGLDVDEFDFRADHLLIIHKAKAEVVGTYRLLLSEPGVPFYSQSEFHIDEFLKTPGLKLELGRACIHPDYRNGNSIDLLWKGLARYIEKSRARYVFGCSSLKTVDPDLMAAVLRYIIDTKGFDDTFKVTPTDEYMHLDFDPASGDGLDVGKELLPPLLRSYLLAGAKVHGLPAYDHEFGCFDLFTILDMEKLNSRFRARYFHTEVMGYINLRPQPIIPPQEAS